MFNHEEREELSRIIDSNKPRFSLGDLVAFKDENRTNDRIHPLRQNQALVIGYDLNNENQSDEPYYDLWTEQANGEKYLCKHVRQSELRTFFED